MIEKAVLRRVFLIPIIIDLSAHWSYILSGTGTMWQFMAKAPSEPSSPRIIKWSFKNYVRIARNCIRHTVYSCVMS
jgi:hypothetical protein